MFQHARINYTGNHTRGGMRSGPMERWPSWQPEGPPPIHTACPRTLCYIMEIWYSDHLIKNLW